MSIASHCEICGQPVTNGHFFCAACRQVYGLTGGMSTWPAWAQQLYRDAQRERRSERRWRHFVVRSIDEDELEEIDEGRLIP